MNILRQHFWDGNATQSTIYTGNAAVITAPTPMLVNNESYHGTISYSYKAQSSAGDYTDGIPADAGTWLVKAHMTASGNYAASDSTDMTLSITPASLTVTGVTSTDRPYNGTTTVALSGGTVNGILNSDDVTLVNTGATGTMLDAKAGTAKSVTITGYSLKGTKAENYIVMQPNDVTVNISKVTITAIADDKTIVKGSALPAAYTVTYNGFVGSDTKETVIKTDAVLNCSAIDSNTVSSYSIIPSGGELNTGYEDNYQLSYANGTLSIVDKTLITITGLSVPTGRIYNGSAIENSDFGIPAYSPVWNGTPTYIYYDGEGATGSPLSDAPKNAGTYTVRIAIPKDDVAYAGYTDLTFTIGKATVVATVDDKSMTAGATLPTFTVSYTGIVSGDSAESIFATAAVVSCASDSKTAGSYPITVTTAVLNDEAINNYIVGVSENGTLNVKKASSGGSSGGSTGAVPINTSTIPISSVLGRTNVSASVDGTIAVLSVTDAQLDTIVSGSKTTGTIKIDVSSLKVDAIVIPSKVVSEMDNTSGANGIEVVLSTGIVALDKTAFDAVSAKGDVKISVEKIASSGLTNTQKAVLGAQADSAMVVDVNVYVNGTKITTFHEGKIKISIPYELKSGQNANSITVWFIKDDGTIEPKSGKYSNGRVEFTTDHLSQYLIVSFPFGDVDENTWYYDSVAYAYNNGLFSGTSSTTFSPEKAMTRQMIWMVLARMDGRKPADMDEARHWAMENGISDGSNPINSINREQLAAILYRYAAYKKYDTTQVGMAIQEFADYDSITSYAQTPLSWAVNNGLIKGSNNKLMPHGDATRAQVAAILMRLIQNTKE